MDNQGEKIYIKSMSDYICEYQEHIQFKDIKFWRKDNKNELKPSKSLLQQCGILDYNNNHHYKKVHLQLEVKEFIQQHTIEIFTDRIRSIVMNSFEQKFPCVFEVCPEFRTAYVRYLKGKKQKKKYSRFTKVNQVHIDFMKNIMDDPRLRNLTVDQKTRRFNERFGTEDFKVSRFTI